VLSLHNYYLFVKEKKNLFYFLLIFFSSIVLAVVEIVGISSLVLFISFFLDSKKLFDRYDLNIKLSLDGILLFVLFIFFIKFLLVIIFKFFETNFSRILIKRYSTFLFINFINNSYLRNLNNKPSDFIRKILNDLPASISYIFLLINILKEVLILILIIFLIFLSGVNIVFFIFSIIALSAYLFYFNIKKKIEILSKKFIISHTNCIEIINNTFASLKEIMVYHLKNKKVTVFTSNLKHFLRFHFYSNFISSIPKFFFEFVAIVTIVSITFVIKKQNSNLDSVLQLISLITLCSLRMIPGFNVITSNLTLMKSYRKIFDLFCKDLKSYYYNQNSKNLDLDINYNNIEFKKSIEFKSLSFKYPKTSNLIFNKTNFTILKNKTIGIYGESGCGKTTLIDIILGIHSIKGRGECIVDGRSTSNSEYNIKWEKAAYVSQNPLLLNDTIKKNIIFDRQISQKNMKNINKILKITNLRHFVKSSSEGLNRNIGNLGSKISGGQKQRIAIARALINKPSIIIFDEPTNALDESTESLIMKEIYKLKKLSTLIIISHKMKVINNCDIIYRIKNKKLIKIK
jgi:ABC-type multidrug transport system fused ATPase/permease subunit